VRVLQRLFMNRGSAAVRSLVGGCIWLASAAVPLTPTLSPRRGRAFGQFLTRRRFMVAMQVPRTLKLCMKRRGEVAHIWRNPFRVVRIRRIQPRVASQARQPWALRRNPFGILGLRRFMVTMQVSQTLGLFL